MQLLDTLNIIIAFATIMLLLSLVVTACVQYTQNILKIRGRVLRDTMVRLFRRHHVGDEEAKFLAEKIIEPVLLRDARPNKLLRALFGTQVTEISLADFRKGLSTPSDKSGSDKIASNNMKALQEINSDVEDAFDKVTSASKMTFGAYAKLVTVLWSLLVAGAFQVSAPDLINRLSADEALRELILQDTEIIMEDTERFYKDLMVSDETARQAVTALLRKYPEHALRIEEISGAGGTPEFLQREVELVFEGHPEAAVIARDYRAILDRSYQRNLDRSAAEIDHQARRLSKYQIDFWGRGWTYYFPGEGQFINLKNLIGVLMTTFLLSLGAPFWYDFIAKMTGLRDALQRKGIRRDDKNESGGPLGGASGQRIANPPNSLPDKPTSDSTPAPA